MHIQFARGIRLVGLHLLCIRGAGRPCAVRDRMQNWLKHCLTRDNEDLLSIMYLNPENTSFVVQLQRNKENQHKLITCPVPIPIFLAPARPSDAHIMHPHSTPRYVVAALARSIRRFAAHEDTLIRKACHPSRVHKQPRVSANKCQRGLTVAVVPTKRGANRA